MGELSTNGSIDISIKSITPSHMAIHGHALRYACTAGTYVGHSITQHAKTDLLKLAYAGGQTHVCMGGEGNVHVSYIMI